MAILQNSGDIFTTLNDSDLYLDGSVSFNLGVVQPPPDGLGRSLPLGGGRPDNYRRNILSVVDDTSPAAEYGSDNYYNYQNDIVVNNYYPEGPPTPGPQGLPGEPGEPGPAGPAGKPGEPGSPGERGPRGFKGPKGDRGPQGFKGDRGPRGLQGRRGLTGEKGKDGKDGIDGTNGICTISFSNPCGE